MDLMNLIKEQIGNQAMAQIGKQVGLNDTQSQSMIASILPTLMASVTKNASTQEGAESLSNALEKDHDGGVFSNIMESLTNGGKQEDTGRATNGAGILKHLLGDKTDLVAQMIGKQNGVSGAAAGSMMQSLAPMLMGMLGQQKKQQGLDVAGLMSMIGGQKEQVKQQVQQNSSQLGFLTNFLDQDGDGSMMDDIAGMATKKLGKDLLGNLFGK